MSWLHDPAQPRVVHSIFHGPSLFHSLQSFKMSKEENESRKNAALEADDEPDDWWEVSWSQKISSNLFHRDKRIFSTGCAGKITESLGHRQSCWIDGSTDENTKMNDCFYEKKDWRLCKNEVSRRTQVWQFGQSASRASSRGKYNWEALTDIVLITTAG